MNASLRGGLFIGLVLGFSLSSVAMAASGSQNARGPSPSPTAEPRFAPGDLVTTAAERSNLMRGDEVVATVPRGQRIVVVEVRGSWVGTHVVANGRSKAGWIRVTDFIPAGGAAGSAYIPAVYAADKDAGLRITLAAKSESTSSPQASAACPIATEPAHNYFSAYEAGYYGRHETDPNIHEWQPWMYNR
jgi:hypothetical protein